MDSADYLERLLPHRLDAVAIAVLLLKYRIKWEEPKPMQIFVEGRLQIEGLTTMFTNPTLEVGVIHARALLEFAGLKVAKDGSLIQLDPDKRNSDDAAIERIKDGTGSLSLISPQDIAARYSRFTSRRSMRCYACSFAIDTRSSQGSGAYVGNVLHESR